MRLEARKYICDIQRAAGLFREFTDGKTFADYGSDAMLRSAVERQFEVVGEAMTSISKCPMLGDVSPPLPLGTWRSR